MLRFPAISRHLRVFQVPLNDSSKSLSTSLKKFGGFMNFHAKQSASCYKSLLSDGLKSQRVDEARAAFDNIINPNVHLYSMMIMGYAKNRRLDDALKLFDEMPLRDTVCWNLMIKGCLDCGNLGMAKRIFDEMPGRNVVSWTTMIHGFMLFGEVKMAELLFRKMPTRDIAVWNSMIHGYCINGRVQDALNVFDVMPSRNVISWTSMIGGLDQNRKSDEALFLFRKMMNSGFKPTSTTLVCAVTASANLSDLYSGIQIHGQIVKVGYFFDEFLSASLITFYSNCKQVENACKVFKEKLHKSVAVWTALVTGYALNSKHEISLQVLRDMIAFGVLPNQSSFTSALHACCGLESLDRGKEIHSSAIKLGG